ncbi:MAG TPA: tyrosine-type recombinase/integrase, partial [Usitatibacter sp.]|nr:tyrosine-type recombinase/integrase [Usitatibacter sp.]
VPLNRDALAVLERRKGKSRRWVFTWRRRPVAKASTKAWAEALKRAKIKDFRWHDLRHTWASRHVMAGTPIYTLMELGAWSSMAMVQKYAHLAPEHLKKWARNVEQKAAQGSKNEQRRKRA